MGRRRKYKTDAERYRAYRRRKKAREGKARPPVWAPPKPEEPVCHPDPVEPNPRKPGDVMLIHGKPHRVMRVTDWGAVLAVKEIPDSEAPRVLGNSPDEILFEAVIRLRMQAGPDLARICPKAFQELERLLPMYGHLSLPAEPSLEVLKIMKRLLEEAKFAAGPPTTEDAEREKRAQIQRDRESVDLTGLWQRTHRFGGYRNA